ncbi:MAG: zinc-binding dehydrogenase [Hyphomicrobium sp.]
MRLTGGRGVDVVLEAVGRDETVGASVDCVRKGGTVVLVGNITPTVTLPLQKVVSRQIRLQGSCARFNGCEVIALGKMQALGGRVALVLARSRRG